VGRAPWGAPTASGDGQFAGVRMAARHLAVTRQRMAVGTAHGRCPGEEYARDGTPFP
jgi:hypothetical protein